MEELISTIVFLLPGFMMYFWIQMFGLNPVVKHGALEITAISALMWFPVAIISLLAINVYRIAAEYEAIINLEQLNEHSTSILFLISYLTISTLISFVFGACWAKWGFKLQLYLVNKIRKNLKVAKLSRTPSVWDEAFHKNEPQLIEYGKIGNEENAIIGEIEKVSRAFEIDKSIYLTDTEGYCDMVKNYKIPVSSTYIDTKTGTYIKIFDSDLVQKAIYDKRSTS